MNIVLFAVFRVSCVDCDILVGKIILVNKIQIAKRYAERFPNGQILLEYSEIFI
jgi:hypothetical protein